MEKITSKELMRRSRSNHNALGRAFTAYGCHALKNVITGCLTQRRAIQSLLQLRDCLLDKDGDLVTIPKLLSYFRGKCHKDSLNLEYYGVRHV